MANKYMLCRLDALQDRRCKSFVIESAAQAVEIFVVRMTVSEVYGYENRCPHTGVQLNWQPDQFFDLDRQFIQCGMHGALFQVQDGVCVRGPCLGQYLTAVKLNIEDDVIWCAG